MKVAPVAALLVAAPLITGCLGSSDSEFEYTVTPYGGEGWRQQAPAGLIPTTSVVPTGAAPRTDGGAPANGGAVATGGTTAASGGTTPPSVPATGGPGVTVSWQAPQYNEDGTPLLDLAGFRIRHGMTYGSYTSQINIDNPASTSYRVQGLAPGLHYFAVSAVDREGQEGAMSRPHRIQVY